MKRFCIPCEKETNANPCKECGADTDPLPKENPREKFEDDGMEYADPRDFRDGRE